MYKYGKMDLYRFTPNTQDKAAAIVLPNGGTVTDGQGSYFQVEVFPQHDCLDHVQWNTVFGVYVARCGLCHDWISWYCPSSPNHLCNYEHTDEQGWNWLDPDDCVYCHQPQERK